MIKQKTILPVLNWAIATSFVLFQFFLQATAGLMAASWKMDFNLTSTQVGSLSAAFFITYVLMQIPVGLAYDRLGARKVLITASMVLAAGIFLLAYSQVYWQAFVSRLLMGMGSGFGFVGMLYVTATWFSGRQFALFVGLAETLAMMGVTLGEIGMAWVITHYGWRLTLMIVGFMVLLITLLVALFIHDQADYLSQEEEYQRGSLPTILGQVLLNQQVWIAGFYGFAMVSIINVFATLWGVSFIEHQYHPISLHTVGSLISMIFLGIGIGGPFLAWLVRYYEDKRRLFLGFFALATTLLLMIVVYIPHLSLWALYFLLLLLGFFSSGYIQVFAVVKDAVKVSHRGTALSTSNMILMSSALLLQPLIGKMLFLGFSYPQALSLLIIVLGVAVVLSFYLDRKKRLNNVQDYVEQNLIFQKK
ncbi:MFS transporter [Legionella israelensis]|uniref:Lysosomal dipeptide transporter MFSD1 n=1 Tax=Legionella israelensis TaxID=454 RepID=A0AAX1EJ45_9GAMM|nr:MFS transporter [Legionella israelensis]QBR85049.1 MFS transporter [Legionella israelensis]